MDIWNNLEILSNKNQGWFFRKDNLDERLNALTQIVENGNATAIYYLIPHLKDRNNEIRNAICTAIVALFSNINSQNGYYNALKNCDISKSDIDFFERVFTTEQFVHILSIASLNGDGRVREKAVNKLATTNADRAIQFITYRLADWVPQVRRAALQGIETFKKTEHIDAIVENLPIFEWLQKVERVDLSPVYNGLIHFILAENKEYIVQNFVSYADKTRLLLAKHISNSPTATLDDIRLLLKDKHFLVRSMAVDHVDRLSPKEMDGLLKDKSKRVRLNVLRKLQDQKGFSNLVKSFVADDSTSIRQFARYSLRNESLDFARVYNGNLAENRKILGSLGGLAETDGKQFYRTAECFLHVKKIKIRKAAFVALTKLNEKAAYDFAIANLDNEFVGIRNVAIAFLQKKSNLEVLGRAREIYKKGPSELKKTVLQMFSNIGGWAVVADLMLGTIDENESIRNLSMRYLQAWRRKAATLFSVPKPHELEGAKKTFDLAFRVHEDKKYSEENPLKGLDFYLR